MDDARVGRFIRARRLRLGWRQADLAGRAGISQQEVSLLERGHLESAPLRLVRLVLRALDSSLDLDVRWRGGAIDRLLDERHATLVSRATVRLNGLGWQVAAEVSYSVFGERGSIDLLGVRRDLAAAVVTEVKSDLTSVEQTQRKHDEKVRLVGRICEERFGWKPRVVGRLLVLPESSTSRRRVSRAADLLMSGYPLRGRAVDAWLRQPVGQMGGILFLPDTTPSSIGRRVVTPGAGRPARGTRPAPPDTTPGGR